MNPIYAAAPPADGERLMVVLRDGDIRVIKNGTTLAQPFLSIPDVDSRSGSGFEGGLLGMAFSPDYLTTGRFYVYMVADDEDPGSDGAPHSPIQIREYKRSAADPEVADPATKRVVLEIAHEEHANHYGGTLQFGPDGLLYASVGDGGGGGDPENNAQDTDEQLGKLLRLDPRKLGSSPYRVPATNPFANGVGGDPLVYAWGLRNPFRFSFDRQTGDLTIGDVGQNRVEEVDFAPSAQGRGLGANFGWDTCEGTLLYNTSNPCTFDHSEPVYTYPNPGCSAVTGGVVVRDPDLPALAGKYVFADYCATYLKSLDLALPTATNETMLSVSVPAFGITAFGEDACGRVHLVKMDGAGTVKRLEEDADPGSCDLTVTYGPPTEGGGPGGGGVVPATPVIPATPALTFSLAGARRQRPLRSGHVGVRLRCSGACSARALGTLTLRSKGRRVRLRQAAGRRSSAGSVTLELRLTKGGRRLLRRALRARRRVRASLTVRVRDSKGALSVRQRTIRLAR